MKNLTQFLSRTTLIIIFFGVLLFPFSGFAAKPITQSDCGATFSDSDTTYILAKDIICGGQIEHALKFTGKPYHFVARWS